MPSFTDAANALRAHLEAGFTALPLRWPNDPREATLDVAPNGFVYSEIRLTQEGPASIGEDGTRTHRDRGEFAVYVYVPRGVFVGGAEGHAQDIRDLFTLKAVDGVTITNRTIGAGSVVEGPHGRLWCVPVFISWFADRIE